MAESEKNLVFSKKTKSFTSSLFNRSLTIHGRSIDSSQKSHDHKPSLDRITSITKFYKPIESVGNSIKGKVKNICKLFEDSKSHKSSSNESQSQLTKLKSTKSFAPEPRLSPFSSLTSSLICLPGTEDRIVVYLTSLRGVRRTFEDCNAVRVIFRGFRVRVDERDVSMDSAYRKELQNVLGAKNVTLPQIFIRGKYVGGADVIKSLFETGELAKILEDFPVRDSGFVCRSCANFRFVPCFNCSGSKKVFDEDEYQHKRCPKCNENGLIRCSDCWT